MVHKFGVGTPLLALGADLRGHLVFGTALAARPFVYVGLRLRWPETHGVCCVCVERVDVVWKL
jgi:hypothetical protein